MYCVIRNCNLQTLFQLRPQNLIGKREDCEHEGHVIGVHLHMEFHVRSITSFESESFREGRQPTSVNKSQQ